MIRASFKCDLRNWFTGFEVWFPEEHGEDKALIRIGFLCFRVLILIKGESNG